MSDRRNHLVLFARAPAFGRGKRRLARELGDLAAHRFQRFTFAALRRMLGRDPRWRLWLALTPDRAARAMGGLPQGGGDLGRRLRRVLASLPPGRVVVIGADAPDVTGADIAAAFRALGHSEAALGPSPDGGYWLIGLARSARRRPPLTGVRWSTPHALADTLVQLQGARVSVLRSIEDVDDAGSHERWLARRATRKGERDGATS